MKIQISSEFDKTLGGTSAKHDQSKSYGEEIMALMSFWTKIRDNSIVNNGINIVVYDPDGTIFVGTEMTASDAVRCGLTSKRITLSKYGYFKHVGPYSQLYQTCTNMSEELSRMGHKPVQPIVEIYGHWTDDESKLETEVLHAFEE